MRARCVLVPVTGEPVDEEALQLAYTLARQSKGRVYVLYVIQVSREYPLDAEIPAETHHAEEVLRWVEHLMEEKGSPVTASLVQAREAGPAVVREAQERGADLIVVGMPYKRHFRSFSMGLTVPYILQHAPCPVVVIREAMPQPAMAQQGARREDHQ